MMFSNEQILQEKEYEFPYHYLDLKCELYKHKYLNYLNIIEIVKGLLAPYTEQKVLDAGCGDGRFCYELSNLEVEVYGIDYSKRAIEFAKLFNPGVEFFVGDLSKLNLSASFDQIVCMEVIEHIDPKYLEDIVKNFHSILKTNGKLILTVPSDNVKIAKKHYQHFNQKTISNLLSTYFEVISIQGCIDTISRKSRIFRILREIELSTLSVRKTSTRILKVFRYLSRIYSNYVKKYFLSNINHCELEHASTIIVVAKKK